MRVDHLSMIDNTTLTLKVIDRPRPARFTAIMVVCRGSLVAFCEAGSQLVSVV